MEDASWSSLECDGIGSRANNGVSVNGDGRHRLFVRQPCAVQERDEGKSRMKSLIKDNVRVSNCVRYHSSPPQEPTPLEEGNLA